MKVCVRCLSEHMDHLCIEGKEERSRSKSPERVPLEHILRTPENFSVDRLVFGRFSNLRVSASADAVRARGWKQQSLLPRLELAQSVIPNAGRGVFAMEFIPAKSLVTMYGGEVMSYDDAMALPKPDRAWVKQLSFQRESIDGRVRDDYTVDFYLQHHYLGSFVNEDSRSGKDDQSLKESANCMYIKFEKATSDLQIYGPRGELQETTGLLMIVATEDIEPGQELFSYYGRDYPYRGYYE